MKIYTVYQVTVLNSWMRFFGTMLIMALVLPSTVFPQSSPAPVNLRTSGEFVILSKTGITSAGVTSINGDIGVDIASPLEYSISQSYPNPFNPTSTIQYAIPKTSFVNISIYNILGNEIKVLINEEKSPGDYEVIFDAKELASGVYFCKLSTGKYSRTKKMVVMK